MCPFPSRKIARFLALVYYTSSICRSFAENLETRSTQENIPAIYTLRFERSLFLSQGWRMNALTILSTNNVDVVQKTKRNPHAIFLAAYS